jgi:hypothetical protein
MESMKPARHTNGEPYKGIQKYAGNGMMRSCGKCLTHKRFVGGEVTRTRGWICQACLEAK